jgi:hypothetical protein
MVGQHAIAKNPVDRGQVMNASLLVDIDLKLGLAAIRLDAQEAAAYQVECVVALAALEHRGRQCDRIA